MTLDVRQVLEDRHVKTVLSILKEKGHKEQDLFDQGWKKDGEEDVLLLSIESDPTLPSFEDSGSHIYRYRYAGPRDSKNREFCAEVLDLDLIYRKEDINQMSFRTENPQFGTYSIFKYKGSYGCRHRWVKVRYSKSNITQ